MTDTSSNAMIRKNKRIAELKALAEKLERENKELREKYEKNAKETTDGH